MLSDLFHSTQLSTFAVLSSHFPLSLLLLPSLLLRSFLAFLFHLPISQLYTIFQSCSTFSGCITTCTKTRDMVPLDDIIRNANILHNEGNIINQTILLMILLLLNNLVYFILIKMRHKLTLHHILNLSVLPL